MLIICYLYCLSQWQRSHTLFILIVLQSDGKQQKKPKIATPLSRNVKVNLENNEN